jgi:hypothetical protein
MQNQETNYGEDLLNSVEEHLERAETGKRYLPITLLM